MKKIPETFASTTEYVRSFIPPLIEETRASLCQNLMNFSRTHPRLVSPLWKSEDYTPPYDFLYDIVLERNQNPSDDDGARDYEPEVGDLIALTEVRPKSVYDLNNPRPYHLAYVYHVQRDDDEKQEESKEQLLSILCSRRIVFERNGKNRNSLFVVYLDNLTTNIRIWEALKPDGGSLSLIQRVLDPSPAVRTITNFFLNRNSSTC